MVMFAAGKVTWKPGIVDVTAAFGEASRGEPVEGITVMTPTTAAASTPTVTVAATRWVVSADSVTLASGRVDDEELPGVAGAAETASPVDHLGAVRQPRPDRIERVGAAAGVDLLLAFTGLRSHRET